MKYVVEVPDNITSQDIADRFVANGNSKTWIMVSPYDRYTKAEIEREHEQVWDFVKTISQMEFKDIDDAFNVEFCDRILQKYSYAEACKMYKTWEESHKTKLKVGDVVLHNDYKKCVLLEKKNTESVELWAVLDEKGIVHQISRNNIVAKIADKHFQEVETLIEKLKEV